MNFFKKYYLYMILAVSYFCVAFYMIDSYYEKMVFNKAYDIDFNIHLMSDGEQELINDKWNRFVDFVVITSNNNE